MLHTEDVVQRRRVDDEHSETGTTNDTGKIPVIADKGKAEGDFELAFHREHVEALAKKDTQVNFADERMSNDRIKRHPGTCNRPID